MTGGPSHRLRSTGGEKALRYGPRKVASKSHTPEKSPPGMKCAGHHGAEDSTTGASCQPRTLYTALAFVHNDFAAPGSAVRRATVLAQGRKLLSFCVDSF